MPSTAARERDGGLKRLWSSCPPRPLGRRWRRYGPSTPAGRCSPTPPITQTRQTRRSRGIILLRRTLKRGRQRNRRRHPDSSSSSRVWIATAMRGIQRDRRLLRQRPCLRAPLGGRKWTGTLPIGLATARPSYQLASPRRYRKALKRRVNPWTWRPCPRVAMPVCQPLQTRHSEHWGTA